jgi:hypothetical protein
MRNLKYAIAGALESINIESIIDFGADYFGSFEFDEGSIGLSDPDWECYTCGELGQQINLDIELLKKRLIAIEDNDDNTDFECLIDEIHDEVLKQFDFNEVMNNE